MEINTATNAFKYNTHYQATIIEEPGPFGDTDAEEPEIIDLDMDPSVLMFPVSENAADPVPPPEEEELSISDALIRCIHDKGRVDIKWIAGAAGVTSEQAIEALRGAIYCNPEGWDGKPESGWEMAEEYLSGNLRHKLIKARIAYKTFKGTFADNVKALERLLPEMMRPDEIYFTLGSPWIPEDIVVDYINYLIQPHVYDQCETIRHDEKTGSWEIPDKGRFSRYVRNQSTYGTKRIDAIHIIENTLNLKTIKISDEVKSTLNKSGTKRVVNREETAAALEKQKLILSEFRRWLFKDEKRKQRIVKIYEDRYGYNVSRRFDGRFLDFPGMSDRVTIRPDQKDSAARIIFTSNTLLARDVGTGKTYIMIPAGMELRRLGLARKIMYVVPNNIVDQWYEIFMTLYPEADVLTIKPKDFVPDKKNKTLLRVRNEDHDAVIIAYSCFDSIPMSRESRLKELREERDELRSIKQKKGKVTGKFSRRLESVEKQMSELLKTDDPANQFVCFDDLGIDRLFVDEAHNYKNVSIDTTITGVYGISSTGSAKCNGMMDKVRSVQRRNNGGGVVMATATPITNSITDIFVFQKYLQNGELELLGIQTFQSWVAMFAEKTTEFEIAVDTNSYRLTTRFSKFHNIPELTTILASIADFRAEDKSEGLPDFKGYTDVLIPRSGALKAYLEEIAVRADKVHEHKVKRKDDNMLKITSDGRKAALDIRLVRNPEELIWGVGISKVSECAERAARIYHMTAANKSTQLVFCDTSTPKAGFNVYDELRRLLIDYGVRENEVAYIHDATTDAKRRSLFSKVRKGEIRILIGSTFKLGLGVNIQDKLIAMHHLDVPWRPADMVQREGRIIRAGNTNSEIFIYRYITEGSFDAYSWQLLETKQRFIVDILSDSVNGRSGEEVDDTVLSYAEVKALALSNPLLKSRVETRNELSRLSALRKKEQENRMILEKRYAELPNLIEAKELELNMCRSDADFIGIDGRDPYSNQSAKEKNYLSKWRRYVRDKLAKDLQDNDMKSSDRNILTYRGFGIVLPAGMEPDHPYLYLVREGRYRVELGEKDGGVLVRIDNYLERLDKRVDLLTRQLEILRQEEKDIETELLKDEDYTEKIEAMAEKLARIDSELGVEESVS